jgi:type IV fimbrial biogenesis protein FimT
MVTVVLIAVGTALALPSYSDMVQKRQLTSGAEQIAAFVNQGKSEAVRRNRVITFSYDRDALDDWCIGAVVGSDSCDCREDNVAESDYCAIDATARILSSAEIGGGVMMYQMEGSGSLAFDPVRGTLLDPNDDLIVHMHSDDLSFMLWVVINEVGEVKVCSKDGAHNVPGYDLC